VTMEVPQFRSWKGHKAVILAVAFAPDSKQMLSASSDINSQNQRFGLDADISLRLWDVKSAKQLKQLNRFADGIYTVAFSPNGRFALFSLAGRWKDGEYEPCKDFNIRMWDLAKDQEIFGGIFIDIGPGSKPGSGPSAPKAK